MCIEECLLFDTLNGNRRYRSVAKLPSILPFAIILVERTGTSTDSRPRSPAGLPDFYKITKIAIFSEIRSHYPIP